MSNLKVHSEFLLEASNRFFKLAQTFEYSQAPLNTDLNKAVGKVLSTLAGGYFNSRGVSSLQVNVDYKPPAANFVIYASGSEADAVQKEMADVLNSKFGPTVSKIMAKYQKDKPIDYKLATFEAP